MWEGTAGGRNRLLHSRVDGGLLTAGVNARVWTRQEFRHWLVNTQSMVWLAQIFKTVLLQIYRQSCCEPYSLGCNEQPTTPDLPCKLGHIQPPPVKVGEPAQSLLVKSRNCRWNVLWPKISPIGQRPHQISWSWPFSQGYQEKVYCLPPAFLGL